MASSMVERKASSVIAVRPIPSTRKLGGMQPSHAKSKSAGMSLRRVRSPVAPKITSTHGSAFASGGGAVLIMGLASIVADMALQASWDDSGDYHEDKQKPTLAVGDGWVNSSIF